MPDRTQLSYFFSFCNDKINPVVLTTNHSNGSFQIERFSRIQHVSIKQISMFHDKQTKTYGSAMVPKARPFDEFFINAPTMINSNTNIFNGENNDLLIKLNKD